MKTSRKLYLLLVTALCLPQHGIGSSSVFTIPNSVLLFGTYSELRIATADRTESAKPPVEVAANEGYFAPPSISSTGQLIAWGFATRVEEERASHKVRYAMGLYSLQKSKWETFGDFDDIGAASFSLDSSKVAFVAEHEGKRELLVLDVNSAALTRAPYPRGMPAFATLSWSPDAKRLAIEIQRGEKNSLVATLDLDTGEMRGLGEGSNPSWSPNGQWIAYYDASGSSCLLVRPDGTSLRTIRKLKQSAFSYRRFGWGGPVWSPDGQQMLLNEMKGNGDYIDVVLVNLETRQVITKAKNCLPVFGWASQER